MWTVIRRFPALSVTALILVAGLLAAWLELPLLGFAAVLASVLFVVALGAMTWDGWHQTTPESLESRGIFPGDGYSPVSDPGLRRDYQPLLPFGLSLGRTTSAPKAKRKVAATPPRSWPAPVRPGPVPAPVRPVPAPAGVATPPAPRGRPARRSRKRGESLQQDATVTLAGERRDAGVDELLAALDDELVGLLPVKQKVAEIGSLLLVDRARQRFGLAASRPSLHMCFTGAPGTGKTTVALMMADLIHRLGYLEKAQVVHAMRDDLVGQFIGQTAPRTKQVLDRAMGGVLFIDEAYTLYRAADSRDYGQECIDILMQVMENQREKLVVILAGYKDRMDAFFESNPGMRSRVAHHLDFAAYQSDELLAIGQLMLNGSSYYLSDAATAAFRAYLSQEMGEATFANARSVRNALESARLRHAYRLAAEPDRPWTKDDLMRLEPPDILPDLYED
jgi:probable Rubsico expression protein CbbX